MSTLLLLLFAACSGKPAEPSVWLPSTFADFQDGVGSATADELTTNRMVLKYEDEDAGNQWATWSALMERNGYTWDGEPSNAMGMTFDTFTHPNGEVRKLIVVGRGGDVFVQMDVEDAE